MDAYLQIHGLDYRIDETQILTDVSLQIKEGSFVGLIGPNGCGKSTLLKHVYKTLKPERDTVYLDGADVLALRPREMAKKAAVMAQENSVEFDVEVIDMVMYGRYAHRKFLEGEKAEDLALCSRLIGEVGLDGYERRSFLSLSGGEKQRVLLARALAQESRLIILDEPTNHLDIHFQYRIMSLLKRQNITVFSAIHDLNLAALYCDRILLMNEGQIVKDGTPQEVLTEQAIADIFHVHAQVTINPITGKIQVYYLPE